MLVYVAVALAVALVLRRGDGPAVHRRGRRSASPSICGVRARDAALPRPARVRTTTPTRVVPTAARSDTGTRSGYWRRSALSRHSASSRTPGAQRRSLGCRCGAPDLATTLYFTFSRGAWAALVIGFAAMRSRSTRGGCGCSGVASSRCHPPCASRTRLASMRSRPRARYGECREREGHRVAAVVACTSPRPSAAAGDGHRVAVVLRLRCSSASFRAARAPAESRLTRARRVFDGRSSPSRRLAWLGRRAVWAAPCERSTSFKERIRRRACRRHVDLNTRLFSISGNGRSEQIRVAMDAGREHPLAGNGAGTFEYLLVRAATRPCSSCATRTRSTWRRSRELGVRRSSRCSVARCSCLLVAGASGAQYCGSSLRALGALLAPGRSSALDWHWELVGVTLMALLAGAAGLLASERMTPRLLHAEGAHVRSSASVGVLLSVLAVWSLVGNQALFAGREALRAAGLGWRRASMRAGRRALLFWSAEPAGRPRRRRSRPGRPQAALAAYREATAIDPQNWVAWLRLAQVARGRSGCRRTDACTSSTLSKRDFRASDVPKPASSCAARAV